MSNPSYREMVVGLFRSHPQLNEAQCTLDWKMSDRRLLFEAHRSKGGVRVTFGRAIYHRPDAVERAYLAAIRMRRDTTLAIRDQQFVSEEATDA